MTPGRGKELEEPALIRGDLGEQTGKAMSVGKVSVTCLLSLGIFEKHLTHQAFICVDIASAFFRYPPVFNVFHKHQFILWQQPLNVFFSFFDVIF